MEDDSYLLHIAYKFSSGLGTFVESDCITEYSAEIHAENISGNAANEYEYVGGIDFKIIHLARAREEGFDLYELFDTYEYTFRHAQHFYDFESEGLKEPLIDEFPDLEYGCNKICIIERIHIVAKYRGRGIGMQVFKNVMLHFGYCELFILQPYPLQFESPEREKDPATKLDLDEFPKNEEKATNSLIRYYETWGFREVKGIRNLMFLGAMYRGDAFENIK